VARHSVKTTPAFYRHSHKCATDKHGVCRYPLRRQPKAARFFASERQNEVALNSFQFNRQYPPHCYNSNNVTPYDQNSFLLLFRNLYHVKVQSHRLPLATPPRLTAKVSVRNQEEAYFMPHEIPYLEFPGIYHT